MKTNYYLKKKRKNRYAYYLVCVKKKKKTLIVYCEFWYILQGILLDRLLSTKTKTFTDLTYTIYSRGEISKMYFYFSRTKKKCTKTKNVQKKTHEEERLVCFFINT